MLCGSSFLLSLLPTMSFWLVSSASTLLGILLLSCITATGSPNWPSVLVTLPKVDVIVFAGIVVVFYLTAILLVGHMVTFSHSFPILSSYSYLLQSHNRKGNVCTGFRMRRAESSVFHPKWLSPTYPLPSFSTLPSFGKQHEQSLWDASSLFSSFSQS